MNNKRLGLVMILTAVIGCYGCAALGFVAGWRLKGIQPQRIPSPRQIQEMVGVYPDGDIGEKTMAAWKEAYCTQSYLESKKGMGIK